MGTEYVVIGAGRFGTAVALELERQSQSVLVVDQDPRLVQAIAPEVHAAVAADTTDERALLELGLATMSTAIVAIGSESVEASILTTALLHQIGVPRIVARAANALHARVLRAVGAHEVISPEEEIGKRLATKLVRPTIKEELAIGNATLAEIEVPERFVGHSLRELDIRNRHGITVMAVRRGEQVLANMTAADLLASGDIMIVIGDPTAVHKIASLA